MSEPTTAPEAPEPAPAPRYFVHEEGSLQAVHNLQDAAPYLEAGYAEVDKATYLAALAAAHEAAPGGQDAEEGD